MMGFDLFLELTSLWGSLCSLYGNKLGPEGGKAIGEALKVNTSITNIR